MSSLLHFDFLKLRALMFTVLCLAGYAVPAMAVPPKAPVIVDFTTTLIADPGKSGTARYYRLKWEDKSVDESGFRIEVRFGNTGNFLYVDSVPADSTEYVLAYDFKESVLAQFRVVAYKYNGNGVESSVSQIREDTTTVDSSTLNAPTNFRVAQVNDGKLKFTWNDNSKAEIYFQIFFKKNGAADSTYATLGSLHLFNETQATVQHGLMPGESYNFAIRATRRTDGTGTATAPVSLLDSALVVASAYPITNPASSGFYKVLRPTPPTGLGGEPVDSERINLFWTDNSDNETSYEVEYRNAGSTSSWQKLTVNRNTTSFTIAVGPGGTYEWRVRAVYAGTALTVEDTDYSNVHTIVMGFIKPQGLVATTSGVSGTVDLTWEDTSVSETNYDIYTRLADEETANDQWSFVQTMLANTTRASVSSYTSNSTTVPLTIDAEHEFVVVARYAGTGIESEESNVAKAYARHGVTSRTYEPAKVGVPFTYTMKVSDTSNRSSWNITDLPAGLSFDTTSGLITGTPTVAGVFSCPMTVNYLDRTATTPLTLRILRAAANPTVAQSIPSVTVGTATSFDIPLEGKFADADSEKAVNLRTTRGDIDILLYPSLTPHAVNNFLGYVNNGAYDGVIFHRSVPTFIVQGGAYVPIDTPNYFSSLIKRPAARNEPGISNVRGTVAHAKVGGNPDSATHDFFFNLEDNSLKANIELDNQNAGFTVFGRVAGTGMSVVDGIAALPIGVYKDYNSSGGSDASLDRRVILDNAKAAFEEVPMNVTGSAPTTMDVNKTVQILRARETPVLRYEVVDTEQSNEAAVRATVLNGNTLRVEGLVEGVSTVTLRARDLDGNAVDQNVAVTVVKGHKPPLITRHPVSVAVLPGGKASMTVTATGSNLTYQWRKGGEAISGQTAKTLSFTNIQAADAGDYDVQVSNSTTTLTSTVARLDLRAAPVVTGHPTNVVVEVGKPFALQSAAQGAPTPTVAWLRTNKAVAGQKLPELKVAAATLTDGGLYVMRATNVAGKADSTAAAVVVIDKSARLLITKDNQTVTLKAQATGPNLTYVWKFKSVLMTEAQEVVDTARVIGANTPTLVIKKFAFNDAGAYTCYVQHAEIPTLNGTTGAWNVGVVGGAPSLGAFTPATAYVGIEYSYTLPGGGASNTSISSFAVSGLPAGLKLDTATGRITGKPTKLGKYNLTVTVKNPAGSKTLPRKEGAVQLLAPVLEVLPLPEAVVGSFIGQIGNSAALNANMGGRVDMTVTDGGLISGKLNQGKEILSFTGRMDQTPGQIRTSGTATVVRKGKAPLQIALTTLSPSGYTDSGNVTGTISDGENSVVFIAYRKIYGLTSRTSPYVGRQHIGFTVPTSATTDGTQPQGSGYAIAQLDDAGVVKVSGRLADGTTITSSSFLGSQQQFLVYQSLYKNTGSVVGQMSMLYIDTTGPVNNRVNRFRTTGQVAWTKAPQTAATERSYKAGFGPMTVDALGMTYVAPGTNTLVMGLPKIARNSSVDFSGGGLAASATNPDVQASTINVNTKGVYVFSIPAGVANDGGVGMAISPGTGMFSGTFKLADVGSVLRTTSYYGLIIPQIPTLTFTNGSLPAVDAIGVGHFMLAQLPSAGPPATTIKNSPLLSGRVDLKPVPITITQQPESKTVNPGASVAFTVVANAPASITYQWRKNGVNISNSNASTYSLSSITEAHEGDYDVVLKTPYSTVISTVAQLSVNDPVSNIVVARTPSANPVAMGTNVVYTVTAKGTGPLTYRWRKNGSDIEGEAAAAATYTITGATLDAVGTYSVRVSSTLSASGLVSAGNDLVIANPITSVVAQRTPAGTSVSIGGTITFSIPSIVGSTAPYTYQWRKDGTAITGATGATHVIDYVNSEHVGVYTVLVKNAVTPEGVLSNDVPLAVNTAVANVNASRNPSGEAVALNSPVTFVVSTQGAGPFTYQWKKNNQIIPGANLASYSIAAVTASDAGNYTAVVSNATTPDGLESNVVILAVQAPITQVQVQLNPNRAVFETGESITFTAVPNAPGPYTFQWYKNDEVIFSAVDATLTLNGMGPADSGNYRVEVKNDVNSAPVSSANVAIEIVSP